MRRADGPWLRSRTACGSDDTRSLWCTTMRLGSPPPRTSGLRRAIAVLVVLLAACGGGGQSDEPADQAKAGQELFEANCSACHGIGAAGTDQGPPLVHEVYEPSHHGDDSFRSAVAQGVQPHHWEFGPMPPIADLDDSDVSAIIDYVRGLQRDAGIE